MSVFVDLQEQESAQVSEQRCVQLEKARRELERQLSGLSDRFEAEEACSAQLTLHRDRLEAECSSLRRDLDELDSALTAAEREKQVDYVIFTEDNLLELMRNFTRRGVDPRLLCHKEN